MIHRNDLARVVALLGAATVLFVVVPVPAQAATISAVWEADGTADVFDAPLTFHLSLPDTQEAPDFTKPQTATVDIGAEVAPEACSAELAAYPTLDGKRIGPSLPLDMTKPRHGASIPVEVARKGTYALRITGSVVSPALGCEEGQSTVEPYALTIELFYLPDTLVSRTKVKITSYGPHTLVANTWRRSGSIHITFTITDPEMRNDLRHSICMTDTDDCWFEDVKIIRKPWSRRTSTGWVRTWDFWWARTSPSDCVSYYWDQPDVSVILVVTNSEGRTVGRKKHSVHLTCRL